jgi:hypothetical protein
MGIVIDMEAYRICQDVGLSIIHRYTQTADEGYSTTHLYLMALQARKIIYTRIKMAHGKSVAPSILRRH